MKTIFKNFILLSSLLPLCVKAQISPIVIPWETGQASLLSELEPVWIVLKKGGTIKSATLREVQSKKGNIVYQKDGCLHDLAIDKITRITAGNNSKSAMFFDEFNKPYIKTLEIMIYESLDYSDFKVNNSAKLTDAITSQKFILSESTPAAPAEKTNTLLTSGTTATDTIIKEDGEIIIAKILEITPTRIKFKKSNNMDGPAYILGNQPSVKILRRPNGIKIIHSEN